ncbi:MULTISPECIES: helix-turn-helix transcriptional regulator [unclassified Amycolatopsis]|uniref:helix-turn-helix domain-containing protein n=1 Tax=unclassified Amycolatopsis TaxID=2618356 RepID=UPI0028743D38|nr:MULTISPECIES: helix-turn-helix transcriptional regulator [unclassified Amycolatopsis]MDS0140563.1 helix-turn-helix transcriptional regulator [Amycolatopsis sp. 505]MDS0149213.1 helix-turn-helix transcriptional regulator [Amycolatopsis sp. CM201R]
MDDSEIPLGATLKRFRLEAGFTQRQLADRSGVSLSLIRALEQGQRQTAQIGSIQALAKALDRQIDELLRKAQALPGESPDAGIVAIRRVLTSVDDLIDEVVDDDLEPVSLLDTSRATTYAWGCYWGGKYDELSRLLAQAMVRGRAAEHASSAHERAAAVDQLAQLQQIAACTLVHLGHPDTAWLASLEARKTSERGDDPLRVAALRGTVSWLLLTQGRYEESRKVAAKTAEKIDVTGKVTPAALSVYGNLLLSAATATGRDIELKDDRARQAEDFLIEARETAERTGERKDYEAPFGREQVTMQTADVHVVTERFGSALETAKLMPRATRLPLAARMRHLTDVAHAQTQLGMNKKAVNTVLSIAASAPDWVRHQSLYKQTVAELDGRQPPTKLHELAVSIGAKRTR